MLGIVQRIAALAISSIRVKASDAARQSAFRPIAEVTVSAALAAAAKMFEDGFALPVEGRTRLYFAWALRQLCQAFQATPAMPTIEVALPKMPADLVTRLAAITPPATATIFHRLRTEVSPPRKRSR